MSSKPKCVSCDKEYPATRQKLGYNTCLLCGEREAVQVRYTIAPMHKSNYMVFSNPDDLKGINNKGGFYR